MNKGLAKDQDRWVSKNGILALSYYDNSIFNVFTNCATPDKVKDTEERILPYVVWLYRQHYGHIDQLDSSIQRNIYSHRTEKYSTRLLQGLTQIGTVVAWRFTQMLWQQEDYPERMFIEGLIKGLLGSKYVNIVDQLTKAASNSVPSREEFHGLLPSNKRRKCALHAEFTDSGKCSTSEWICSGCKDDKDQPLFFHIHCHYWYFIPRDEWPENLVEQDFKFVHEI